MLLMFILTSILYLIMIYSVLSLYYKYRKDYEEIENRLLQLEKSVTKINKDIKIGYEYQENQIEEIFLILKNEINLPSKDGDNCMACKKGRGGRKK